MKRLVMSLAWLGLLCGTVVMAQEPKPAAKAAEQEISDPTATQWTVEKLDQLPKREVKFEQSDQPLPRQHVPLNATLLAQRYIATLNFE
ncbi:MAG TPA: hypothetical protein VL096_09315, partial [Pirellulaceae bacterium]|nr:hypothetical protein [Pirellulaceae bacterium]